MEYFYKRFDYSLATCKLMVCDETIFTGLEKHGNYAKDAWKHMAVMCLIETYIPQLFYHLCNDSDNGIIFGKYTYIYPKNISKAYDVLCKYNTPENSPRLPRKRTDVSFNQQGARNQTFPPASGTDDVLHKDFMCYNCDRSCH